MGIFDLDQAAQRAADVAQGSLGEVFSRASGLGPVFGNGPLAPAGGSYGMGPAGGSPGLAPAYPTSPLGSAGDVWGQALQGAQDQFATFTAQKNAEFQKSHDYLSRLGQAKDQAVDAVGNAVSSVIDAGKGAAQNVLRWKDDIERAAQEFNVPAHYLAGLVDFESSGDPNARSPVGAIGLAQLMPGTAQGLGVNPYDPRDNLRGGAKYLRQLFDKYGDWNKAFVAYNAGSYNPSASYNGFSAGQYAQAVAERAQRYASAPVTPNDQVSVAPGSLTRPSQFDRSLTASEAYVACGPAAAVAFARAVGRAPTLREAVDIAKTVGWTPQGGMNGIANESKLLDRLGVAHELTAVVDPQRLAASVGAGKPVMISTVGHYFTADAYDPDSDKFHVGTSGTDLIGGSGWMTLQQMTQIMGAFNGVLYLR